ncbi:MAG: flagellar export chaperone FliS [Ruminococcus sp.]|nr:flagellar export chaperone FliS [Ruminococcus sp.]MBR1752402.1 flagellar export chaperone FliS [Ruminococcus sp.]
MADNPYKKYREQSINTMTQGELLNLLFETCVKRLTEGVMYIEEKDYSKANESLQKAERIIRYLDNTLDRQYEIANDYSRLYEYFLWRIMSGNIHKDVEPINEVIPMISDLGKTFKEAERIARQQQHG